MKIARKLIISLLLVTIVTTMIPLTVSASGEIAWGAANVNGNNVRIRSGPGLTHSVLTHASTGDIVVVIKRTNSEWYKVNFHGTIGYMSVPLLEKEREAANFNKRGSVAFNNVNMRERPNTSSSVLGTHGTGTEMDIIGINNGWYKVVHASKTGYIRSDLMTIIPGGSSGSSASSSSGSSGSTQSASQLRVTPTAPAPDPNLPLGQQIADFAVEFLGYKYRYAGSSPSTGFDCSGFVTYVMKQYDISLTRNSSGMYKNNGSHINKSDLVPGDLVFFSNNRGRSINHVGIYIGNDNFVHSSSARVGVIISSLNSPSRIASYVGAKRVVT